MLVLYFILFYLGLGISIGLLFAAFEGRHQAWISYLRDSIILWPTMLFFMICVQRFWETVIPLVLFLGFHLLMPIIGIPLVSRISQPFLYWGVGFGVIFLLDFLWCVFGVMLLLFTKKFEQEGMKIIGF